MKVALVVFALAFIAASLAAVDCLDSSYSGVCVLSEAPSDDLAQLAVKYVGKLRYYYGGTDLERGVDCSGFVQQLYLQSRGSRLSRTAASQFNDKRGILVNKNQLQSGDLVFFKNTGSRKGITHVGIFLSGCNFIHAPGTGKKVSYGNFCSPYYREHYAGARRV
ncbi:MAG: C40 family peptidase [Candidatus Micrarchaeota archaeon]